MARAGAATAYPHLRETFDVVQGFLNEDAGGEKQDSPSLRSAQALLRTVRLCAEGCERLASPLVEFAFSLVDGLADPSLAQRAVLLAPTAVDGEALTALAEPGSASASFVAGAMPARSVGRTPAALGRFAHIGATQPGPAGLALRATPSAQAWRPADAAALLHPHIVAPDLSATVAPAQAARDTAPKGRAAAKESRHPAVAALLRGEWLQPLPSAADAGATPGVVASWASPAQVPSPVVVGAFTGLATLASMFLKHPPARGPILDQIAARVSAC